MKNKRKNIYLMSLVMVGGVTSVLTLPSLSCNNIEQEILKYINNIIEDLEIDAPLYKYAKDVTKDDLKFKGFNKNDWEIDKENLSVIKNGKTSILIRYRLKHKTKKNVFSKMVSRIITGFKLDSEENIDEDNINKIAQDVKFDYIGSTPKTDVYPAALRDIHFKAKGFEFKKYRCEIVDIEANNKTGSVLIKYKLINKNNNKESIEFLKSIKGFKSEGAIPQEDIDNLAQKTILDYDGNKANVYATSVLNNKITAKNYDESKYDFIIESIENKNDELGSLIVKYKLRNKITSSESKVWSKIIEGFRIKQNNENIDEIASNVSLDADHSKLPSQIKNDDIFASNYDSSLFDFKLISITNVNDINGSLVVNYQLINKKTNKKSAIISKPLDKFAKSPIQNINEIAKNINVFYKGNSQDKLPSEVNDLEFEGSNFDKNKYKLEIMSLTNVNDKNGTLEVKYRLRTIDNSEISSIFSKVVSGFKKDNNSSPNPLTKSKVRLAHWNVCNFGDGAITENQAKAKAIASVIHNQKYDVVGLTELDGLNVAPHLADLLNEIERKNHTGNVWKYVNGDYSQGPGSSPSQAPSGDKAASFIYKENIVRPKPFKDGKIGKFYDGTYFENKFGTSGTYASEYKRPPFCVRWESVLNGLKHVDFTFGISHFDGPGVKAEGERGVKVGRKTIGSLEANEAWNIKNMFKWLKDQTDGDDDLIFQGDTNIPKGSADDAFGLNSNEKMILDESSENYSSLGKSIGKYAQPYDKIIHSSNLNASNGKVYKLWDFPKQDIFQWATIKSLDQWKNWCTENSKPYGSKTHALYNYVSDHCPISYDLELDSSDTK